MSIPRFLAIVSGDNGNRQTYSVVKNAVGILILQVWTPIMVIQGQREGHSAAGQPRRTPIYRRKMCRHRRTRCAKVGALGRNGKLTVFSSGSGLMDRDYGRYLSKWNA